MNRFRIGTSALVAALVTVGFAAPASGSPAPNTSPAVPRLAQPITMGPDGRVDVVVGLQAATPGRANIAAAQRTALEALTSTGHRVLRRFELVPYLVLEVDAHALDVLEKLPTVTSIRPDVQYSPTLAESTGIIRSPEANDNGATGRDRYADRRYAVAVLDTGVDVIHPFVSGRTGPQACFSTRSDRSGKKRGGCPNGETTMYGNGAARPCAIQRCDHGTAVAGIAAGWPMLDQSGVLQRGVAPEALVIPVQVFHEESRASVCPNGIAPCVQASSSDIAAAMEWTVAAQSTPVAAINLSMGGALFDNVADCEAADPLMRDVIHRLGNAQVQTVVASGNDGAQNALSSPACISEAVSVGATTDGDTVAGLTNSAPFLDLLAPGVNIQSSAPNSSWSSSSGTSLAAPHVSGAITALKSRYPKARADDILEALKRNGRAVQGPNGVVTTRIDVKSALDNLVVQGIEIFDATVWENEGTAEFVLRLKKPAPEAQVLTYVTRAGTASQGGSVAPPKDYEPTSGEVRIEAGQLAASVRVPIIDDTTQEEAEYFRVQFTQKSGSVPLSDIQQDDGKTGDNWAIGWINDNDAPVYQNYYSSGNGYYYEP